MSRAFKKFMPFDSIFCTLTNCQIACAMVLLHHRILTVGTDKSRSQYAKLPPNTSSILVFHFFFHELFSSASCHVSQTVFLINC